MVGSDWVLHALKLAGMFAHYCSSEMKVVRFLQLFIYLLFIFLSRFDFDF
eukprot:m.165145 g.165145  ORF g.165145 m.165145 type:complete len:50 (-) comp13433_c2_seq1:2098-2247(-)